MLGVCHGHPHCALVTALVEVGCPSLADHINKLPFQVAVLQALL